MARRSASTSSSQTKSHRTSRVAHEKLLLELTSIPTAAGREDRVIAWVERWVKARPKLRLRRDKAGNLLITRGDANTSRSTSKSSVPAPLYITAHLDHPAFVVHSVIDARTIELEFRGGVHDPYFDKAQIDIFDSSDHPHRARIDSLDPSAKPFKRITAMLGKSTDSIQPGDIGRWVFE
jgi:putative aminopeptidase FrvX